MDGNRVLIPNTTQVPNVLLDEIIPKLKPGAVRVLLAIVRLTYGWGKQSDRIGISQLQRNTGLSREGVIQGTKDLGNLLTIKRSPKNSRIANEYALNVDISSGQLVHEFDQLEHLISQVTSQKSRLSQTNSKPKEETSAKKRGRPKGDSDPRVKEILLHFAAEYTRVHRKPFHIVHGKGGAIMKDLLRTFTLDDLKRAVTGFMESSDSWIKNAGFGFGVFQLNVQKFIPAQTPARRREIPVADLA